MYGSGLVGAGVRPATVRHEHIENGRRLFTIAAVVDGQAVAEGRAFNKKDASQIAAQLAVERLGIGKEADDTE